MVVAGQIAEGLKLTGQDKAALSLIHTYAHQRGHLLHVRGKYDGRLFCSFELRREPGLTQLHLQQGLEPQFCLVLPLHLAGTGVVDGKNIAASRTPVEREPRILTACAPNSLTSLEL